MLHSLFGGLALRPRGLATSLPAVVPPPRRCKVWAGPCARAGHLRGHSVAVEPRACAGQLLGGAWDNPVAPSVIGDAGLEERVIVMADLKRCNSFILRSQLY